MTYRQIVEKTIKKYNVSESRAKEMVDSALTSPEGFEAVTLILGLIEHQFNAGEQTPHEEEWNKVRVFSKEIMEILEEIKNNPQIKYLVENGVIIYNFGDGTTFSVHHNWEEDEVAIKVVEKLNLIENKFEYKYLDD